MPDGSKPSNRGSDDAPDTRETALWKHPQARFRECYDRFVIRGRDRVGMDAIATALLSPLGFLPYRNVASAFARERFALPVAPAFAQGHSGKAGHQVKLGRPDEPERR